MGVQAVPAVAQRDDRRTAYVTLLVGMVAFGGTWPAGKVAAEHVLELARSLVGEKRFSLAVDGERHCGRVPVDEL